MTHHLSTGERKWEIKKPEAVGDLLSPLDGDIATRRTPATVQTNEEEETGLSLFL